MTPQDVNLSALSGTAANDVWAVGLHDAILHWDGHAWERSHVDSDTTLLSIWAAAPDDAWAVGGELLHWDGERWAGPASQP